MIGCVGGGLAGAGERFEWLGLDWQCFGTDSETMCSNYGSLSQIYWRRGWMTP